MSTQPSASVAEIITELPASLNFTALSIRLASADTSWRLSPIALRWGSWERHSTVTCRWRAIAAVRSTASSSTSWTSTTPCSTWPPSSMRDSSSRSSIVRAARWASSTIRVVSRRTTSGSSLSEAASASTASAPTGVFSSWLMLATKSVRTASSRARSLTSSIVASANPSASGSACRCRTRRGGPANSIVRVPAWPFEAARSRPSTAERRRTASCPVKAPAALLRTCSTPSRSASTTPVVKASRAVRSRWRSASASSRSRVARSRSNWTSSAARRVRPIRPTSSLQRHLGRVVSPLAEALGALVLRQPTGDDELHPLADGDGVVADALVEAGDHGQLHGHLQVDPPGGVALEDGLDELLLQAVEVRVHVVDRRGLGQVAGGEGVDRCGVQLAGLLAHRGDDAAQLGVELVAPDPPGRLADVGAEVGRPLDLGDHPHQRHDHAQVGGHRRLQGDQPVAALLEIDRAGIDLVVAADQVVGTLEVAVEQDRRRPGDQLRDGGGEVGQLAASVLQLLMEALAQLLGHQPNLPEMYASVRSSLGVENIRDVRSTSTSTPVRRSLSWLTSVVKNATRSLTRAACCMLWVTITIVKRDLISCIRSSMREVAIGSSAEHGSSIKMTSGRTAIARAMHSRCC